MAKQLDPKIADTLKKFGYGPEACWQAHGNWVIYHKVLEQIAVKYGIKFDAPQVIECSEDRAAVCVTGHYDGKSIWSIGEAAPNNNKNAYKWAMAEKRAIDRVILKLIGLHGDVYSEEEADDLKASKPGKLYGPLGKSALQKAIRALTGDIASCQDYDQLTALLAQKETVDIMAQCERDEPSWWFGGEDKHGEEFDGLKDRIQNAEEKLAAKDEM